MIYIDSHCHTKNSPDGNDSVISLVDSALAKGMSYLATTDHLDYDLLYGKNSTPVCWNHINLDKYKQEWIKANEYLKTKNSNLKFCFGIEAGFDSDAKVLKKYQECFDKYNFDVVINSVHFVSGMDVYFPMAFLFKSKNKMYNQYLDKVLLSLDVPYHYDIVGHLGYVTRNAPYLKKELILKDFSDKLDKVLNGIIQREKALEVNTHHDMNPTREVLQRYFDLGGRKLSFGSDTHRNELLKDFEKVSSLLQEIGFTHFSTFHQKKETLVPIG